MFALSPEDEAAEREKELLSSKANAIRVWLDGASIVYRKIWLDELFKSCLPTTLKVCLYTVHCLPCTDGSGLGGIRFVASFAINYEGAGERAAV